MSKSFSLQIADFIEKTKSDADKVVRGVLLGLDAKLIEKSPVGDGKYWKRPPPPGYTGGRFRGAWQMAEGSPATGDSGLIDKDGKATMAAHASVIATAKAGTIHYITNNLPYAKRIEEGWSREQAPVGVVALTIVEFQTLVDNEINGVRNGTSAADFTQGWDTYKL